MTHSENIQDEVTGLMWFVYTKVLWCLCTQKTFKPSYLMAVSCWWWLLQEITTTTTDTHSGNFLLLFYLLLWTKGFGLLKEVFLWFAKLIILLYIMQDFGKNFYLVKSIWRVLQLTSIFISHLYWKIKFQLDCTWLKFVYSVKATKFCEIFTLLLS